MIKKTIKLLLVLGIFLGYSGGVFVVGYLLGQETGFRISEQTSFNVPRFSSQEVLDSVNEYRKSQDLQELVTDKNACNFVIERWFAVQTSGVIGVPHPGFEEFVVELAKVSPYIHVGEIYTFAVSPRESIKNWVGSPSHRLILEDSVYNAGCAYSYEGRSIVILVQLPE